MINRSIEIGGVYRGPWSDDPIRVLAFDRDVVMYDVWFPHKNAWSFAQLNRTMSYYRISSEIFLSKYSFIRTEECTQAELETHRPDLPFTFAQHSELNWYDNMPEAEKEISEILITAKKGQSVYIDTYLDIPKLYLEPFGPKDGSKPGALITARNGIAFTQVELLWHAWHLQKPHLRDITLTKGVGLYRSGVQKRLPSYYIWGAESRLNK